MHTQWLTAFVIGMGVPLIVQRPIFAAGFRRLVKQGMNRINYRGVEVVTAGGVMIVASSTAGLCTMLLFLAGSGTAGRIIKEGVLMGAGMLAMALWGWQDDVSHDKQAKGFRGHFGTLWREKRMTSGLWKAWGGASTSMLVSLSLTHSLWPLFFSAGLLAMTPNVLNLFDLRPVRAIKVFWFLLAISAVGTLWGPSPSKQYLWLWLLPVVTASMLFFRHEASGRIMLGDTGANALGFIAGYSLVIGLPMQAQAGLLVLFVVLHVLAEFISFSALIQRFRWLEWIDRWGRRTEWE